MKIEMGESLFYSWLRHVKECQIVQTNWKTSPQWTLQHETELEKIMSATDEFFQKKYGYRIYKQTSSLSQLLQQAECDAVGISIQDGVNRIYAVDVAFHEAGLNYGNRDMTVMKVIAKSLRTAMCIYGYLDSKDGEITFASPKINKRVLADIGPCLEDMQAVMDGMGYSFRFRVIANEEFKDKVLSPILMVSDGVADTTELFLRGYQMLQMFDDSAEIKESNKKKSTKPERIDAYAELKIGKLAQIVMRRILESGNVSQEEILLLQDKDYSKKMLDLNFPALVKQNGNYDKVRYYKDPVIVGEESYMLCSQWSESSANNDRPFLVKWIEEHEG